MESREEGKVLTSQPVAVPLNSTEPLSCREGGCGCTDVLV